ncbi:MAG: hypothetical protein ABI678_29105, partial [Kofleriaceae bacterium]
GKIAAQALLKVENLGDRQVAYRFELVGTPGTLRSALPTWEVAPHHAITVPLFVDVPRGAFVRGQLAAHIQVSHAGGFAKVMDLTLFGPDGGGR